MALTAALRLDGAPSRGGDRSAMRGSRNTAARRHSVPSTKTTNAKHSAGPRAIVEQIHDRDLRRAASRRELRNSDRAC